MLPPSTGRATTYLIAAGLLILLAIGLYLALATPAL